MLVTIEIDPARRTAEFREVSYLAAGDSCRVVLDGVRGADFGSLALLLYRDAASDSPVASCASFAPVRGHPSLADGELALDTFEMEAWFADAVPGESDSDSDSVAPAATRTEPRLAARESLAERSVRASGWLVVLDRDRTWAACRVPVLLRPVAGSSGAPDPASVSALVSALVEGLVSAALSGKADKVPSAVPGNLASLDASGNLVDSGSGATDFAPARPFADHVADGSVHHTEGQIASIAAGEVARVVANAPGTMDTLKEIADILGSAPESGTVMSRISALESGKADSSSLAAVATSGSYGDLSGKPTIPAVDAAFATQGAAADAKAVGDALDGKRGMDDLSYAADDWFVTGAAEMRLVRDSSFLPPMFGWSATVAGEKWFLLYGGPGSYWEFGVVNEYDARDWESGADATSLTFEIDGSVYNLTKGRRIALTKDIPTKTSQLRNDGDGASPFATEAGLAGRRGLSDRSFVRALSPESYRWSLSVPGGSAVELLPDPNGVQWASGSSDGDYALLKGALVSSGDRSWTLMEIVSGSPSEVGVCVAAEGAGELDFGQGYVARHVRSEWEADDSLALSSEVDAAVAPKADAADLPYALVTPAEWEFSGSGMQGGHAYDVVVTQDGGEYFYMLQEDGTGISTAVFDTPQTSVDFSDSTHADPAADIAATRALALQDRAVNSVSVSSALVLTLPAAVSGKARDFLVYAETSNSAVPSFAANGQEQVSFVTGGGEFPEPDSDGLWSYSFTEMAAGVFAVSLIKLEPVVDEESSS